MYNWISDLTSRRAWIQTNARISLNNTVAIPDQFEILIDKLCILLKFGIHVALCIYETYYSIYKRCFYVIMSFTADYKLQCNLVCIVIYF
jgi:hypothetical protein